MTELQKALYIEEVSNPFLDKKHVVEALIIDIEHNVQFFEVRNILTEQRKYFLFGGIGSFESKLTPDEYRKSNKYKYVDDAVIMMTLIKANNMIILELMNSINMDNYEVTKYRFKDGEICNDLILLIPVKEEE